MANLLRIDELNLIIILDNIIIKNPRDSELFAIEMRKDGSAMYIKDMRK